MASGRGPRPPRARAFFADSRLHDVTLVTSAEVLQELMHAYLPVGRHQTLEAAFRLVDGMVGAVWHPEPEDARLDRDLAVRNPALGPRDLVHLASCRRRRESLVKTFDRALAAAV